MLFNAPLMHFAPMKLCGGLIYSGHTCYFMLCALIWSRYGSSRWVARAFWLLLVAGAWALLSCRYHYTVDVVLAVGLCGLFWALVHTTIDALPL